MLVSNRFMTRFLAIVCLLTGCAPTPQTAREGTPLVPLSVQAVNVAPAGLRSIATPSGLQSAYNTVGRIEPNVPDGTTPNRSSPVSIVGTIVLTQPVRVPGNSVTVGAGNGGMLVYMGTDVPIYFYSATGGASTGIHFDHVSIYAPNARALWDWDTAHHAGNEHVLTFENAAVTCNAGPHFNLNAPGDGRAYDFTFRNIDVYGTGPIARNDAQHAAPIVLFDHIRCVNRQLSGPAFDLCNVGGEIRDSWIELVNTQLIHLGGAFSFLRWTNNYSEPHGTMPNGEMVRVDGPNTLDLDALYFINPAQHLTSANGGKIVFRGLPDCTNLAGGHPDWTQPLLSAADLLQQCFITTDARSVVAWPTGRIDAAGLHRVNVQQTVQQEQQAATAKKPTN
jgi:hypothetical protein